MEHEQQSLRISLVRDVTELQRTVFLDNKAVGYLLSFVRRGGDKVVPLYSLGNHGMGEIQDSAHNGLIQPLGNAIRIGILDEERKGANGGYMTPRRGQ